jgi:hypothetical protein
VIEAYKYSQARIGTRTRRKGRGGLVKEVKGLTAMAMERTTG